MKKFLLLLVMIVGFLFFLPTDVLAADVVNNFKCVVSRDTDGLTVKNCTFEVTITGNGKFNHTEGSFQLVNMQITSFEANRDFVLEYDSNANYFKLSSNHVYTSAESGVVYATLVAKQVDKSVTNCNIAYVPNKTSHELTNTFNITKEAYKDGVLVKQVKRGEEFQYKITVTSANNILKTDNVVVTDTIPNELEIINAYSGVVNEGTITWNLGSFEPGVHTKTIFFDVRAKKDTKGIVNNEAVLKVGDNTFKDDVDVEIVYSEIGIEKKVSRDKVGSNEEFYYIITVQNKGTATSEKVIVEDTIDEYLTFLSASENYTNNGNTYYFDIGTLQAKGTKTIRINVKAPETRENKIIPNVVIATEEGKDPVRDDVDVEIIPDAIEPVISIKKAVNKTTVKKSEEFLYTITVSNGNELNLSDVVVTDLLDSNLEIVEAKNGVVSNNLVTWTIDIAANESKNLTILVKVKNASEVEKIINDAKITYEGKEIPSNKVEVSIIKDEEPPKEPEKPNKPDTPNKPVVPEEPEIENPQTGRVVSLIVLGALSFVSLILYFYVNKHNKMYRL